VNIPAVAEKKIKGIRVCRQAQGTWQEDFDERQDPHGRKYYWMTGVFIKTGHGRDTDEWALENDYIAVVPVQFDFTAVKSLKTISNWFR
jgi:5'-nucleotidase